MVVITAIEIDGNERRYEIVTMIDIVFSLFKLYNKIVI